MDFIVNVVFENGNETNFTLPITKAAWNEKGIRITEKMFEENSVRCTTSDPIPSRLSEEIDFITSYEKLSQVNWLAKIWDDDSGADDMIDSYLDSYSLEEFVGMYDQYVDNSFSYDMDLTDNESFGIWYFGEEHGEDLASDITDYMDWEQYGEDNSDGYTITSYGMVKNDDVDDDYRVEVPDMYTLESKYDTIALEYEDIRESLRGRWIMFIIEEHYYEEQILGFTNIDNEWSVRTISHTFSPVELMEMCTFADTNEPVAAIMG